MLLCALMIVLFAGARVAGSGAVTVTVPQGERVLLDGQLGPGEWSDARRVAASESVVLLLKRDAKYLYVAVQPTGGAFGMDLYFDRGDAAAVLDLHASAKLGEREGKLGQLPDWSWWNNRGWAANVVRVKSFEPREFLPDVAREYQIDLARLGGRHVWLSLDVQAGNETRSLPREGVERYGRRWLELQLSRVIQ